MAPQLVIDTDVASYIFKEDTRAKYYAEQLIGKELIISFITISEIRWWMLRYNWGEKRQAKLKSYLEKNYIPYFCDEDLCSLWAEVYEYSRRKGFTMSRSDVWVAATALLLEVPLATNNYKDYCHLPNLEIVSFSQTI